MILEAEDLVTELLLRPATERELIAGRVITNLLDIIDDYQKVKVALVRKVNEATDKYYESLAYG